MSQVAHFDGAERFTNALAHWTTHLWHPLNDASEAKSALTCYIDGHRKPVYTDACIPRGLVGRLGAILRCRALVLLHDEQGHPLLATTHRGDQHLMGGLPSIIARYEQQETLARVERIIVDREGMGTEFLAGLHAEGRMVVTILRTNQYQDLTSFCGVGTFLPLSIDAKGQIIREVAPACITLPRLDHPGEQLCLQVALIRDLRRLVAVRPDHEDADLPRHWDADRERTDPRWWEEGWHATATPAKEVTAKLIPIVTTAPTIDAIELARTYIQRLRKEYKRRADELYRELGLYQTTLELQGVADYVLRRQIKERRTVIEAELEPIRAKEWRAYEQCNNEFRKQERYCKEQRDMLRALEDLEEQERTMYELDYRKDQVMTVCKVAMANLAMWVRDLYFPASYAHATWRRLLPFFQLPGIITCNASTIQVELCLFNDRALNRDLALLCERVNQEGEEKPE